MSKKNPRSEYKTSLRAMRLFVLPDGRTAQQAIREAIDSGYNPYATRPISTDMAGLLKRLESRLRMAKYGVAPWAQKNPTNVEGCKNALEYAYRTYLDAQGGEHEKWRKKESALRGFVIAVLSNGVSRRFSSSTDAYEWINRRIKGKPGMQGGLFRAEPGPYHEAPFSLLETNEHGVVHHGGLNAWKGTERDPGKHSRHECEEWSRCPIHRSEKDKKGPHACKLHKGAHHYVQHTCGKEYCPHTWKMCPRCYGNGPENRIAERDPATGPSRKHFTSAYRVTHIRLDKGGYAPSLGHRYFGTGPKLWMVERVEDEHFVIVRASSAEAARKAAVTNPRHWGGWRRTF